MATLQTELIPGTEKRLHELGQRGYRLAIVSNGPVGSIPNVLGPLWLTWSPRRRKTQNSESEVLHHVIAEPADLVPLIEILDSEGMK
jgi:hypothetical protein